MNSSTGSYWIGTATKVVGGEVDNGAGSGGQQQLRGLGSAQRDSYVGAMRTSGGWGQMVTDDDQAMAVMAA